MAPRRSFKLIAPVLAVAVVVLLAEAALWLFYPVAHPYAPPDDPDARVFDELGRGPMNRYVPYAHGAQTFELRPDAQVAHGLAPEVEVEFNQFGFRSSRTTSVAKPQGVRRIVAIGGSTTECLYLGEDDAWPEVVQHELEREVQGLDVINAGFSGNNSRDHLSLLAHRVAPFEPDVVLFLVGVNELSLHLRDDYSALRTDEMSVVPQEPITLATLVKSSIADVSQVARLLIHLRRGQILEDERGNPAQDLHGRWMVLERQRLQSLPERDIDISPYPHPEYEQNLRMLVGMTRALGAEPVLLTQPAIWGSPPNPWEHLRWIGPRQDFRLPVATQSALLEAFNDVMRKVAREMDVPLIDLARELPKDVAYYYDDIHFTIAGSRRVGELVAAGLRRDARITRRLAIESYASPSGSPGSMPSQQSAETP